MKAQTTAAHRRFMQLNRIGCRGGEIRRFAFTFIELLMVISIVCLLCAMLFQVVVQSKKLAVRTSCAGNMHQIGLAFDLYAGDYDDLFPAAVDQYTRDRPETWPDPMADFSDIPDVTDVIAPYLMREMSVLKCPGDTEPYRPLFNEVPGTTYANAFAYAGTSYHFIYQDYFGLSSNLIGPNAPLCIDASPFWHGPKDRTGHFFRKSFNALFADGRVRFSSISEMGR